MQDTPSETRPMKPLSRKSHDASSAERANRRVRVVLPLRVTYWDLDAKPCPDMACTYDISSDGARISGLKSKQKEGEIVALERGKSKAFCRVVWVGDPDSEFRGQVGVQNVESSRPMWEAELRELQEAYDVVAPGPAGGQQKPKGLDGDRRRHSRFSVVGVAEIGAPSKAQAGASLKNLSETGCLVVSEPALRPGSELKLHLKIGEQRLVLKGIVRHADGEGAGIEFREIRKGDRQLLEFLLSQMAEQELESSFQLEPQS
jgi:hypothetical protein